MTSEEQAAQAAKELFDDRGYGYSLALTPFHLVGLDLEGPAPGDSSFDVLLYRDNHPVDPAVKLRVTVTVVPEADGAQLAAACPECGSNDVSLKDNGVGLCSSCGHQWSWVGPEAPDPPTDEVDRAYAEEEAHQSYRWDAVARGEAAYYYGQPTAEERGY